MRRRLIGLAFGCLIITVAVSPAYASPGGRAKASGATTASEAGDLVARTSCAGGVSTALKRVGDSDADRMEELQAKYQDEPGFLAVINDGKGFVVVVDTATFGAWQKNLGGGDVSVAVSCVPTGTGAAVADAVDALKLEEGEFVATGYDVISDSIFVESTFDDAVIVDAINAKSPEAAALVNADDNGTSLVRTSLFEKGAVGRSNRLNDLWPFWGGARTLELVSGSTYHVCTTGFYIDSATNGTAMVTAAHCQHGTSSNTVWNGDLSDIVGTAEGIHFPDPDMMLIDGESYQPISYSANNITSSKFITASHDPGTAVTYCQFGAVTYRACYQYDNLDTKFCDVDGCTYHLAHAVQQALVNQGGDSGGGVFKEIAGGELSARGIVIAGGCNQYDCLGYDHKRQTILNVFDATVVLH